MYSFFNSDAIFYIYFISNDIIRIIIITIIIKEIDSFKCFAIADN